MKQVTARTPAEVKSWVDQHGHHIGYVEGSHPNYTHLTLQGRRHRLRIPTAVHRRCKLVPSTKDASRLFVWNERAARQPQR